MPLLAVPLLLAAQTALPGVARTARTVDLTLFADVAEHTCPGAVSPAPWRDPSSAWFFAAGPTARLDAQELAAGVLASLVDLRFVRGALRLFVVGSPIRGGLRFTGAGWRPRWPNC